ncbi:2OG-Fe(II) oxygenase family protein [Blastomonas sp.]|uniref:2OG-Fe(II) oxygenase n=1 Tax=Blastomonas sp. TaxID=1909299 RepID=UPI003593D19D
MTNFTLNPDLDRNALAECYAQTGRVRLYGLLAQGATDLHDHLRRREDWIQVIHAPGAPIELDRHERAAMGAKGIAQIDREMFARGRDGFQYRYEALRLPDADEPLDATDMLSPLAKFLHGPDMHALIRHITGMPPGLFVNGQATSYGVGDFLTGHDDDAPGENRMAACVFGLTQMWRLEWGGLLLFHGPHERTAEALVPRFNTLDLFRVPQQHSVSLVSPSAGFSRLAVTGWYRGSPAENH